jgi:predicted dehydrogenase
LAPRVEFGAAGGGAEAAVRLGVLGAGAFATGVMLPALRGLEGVERVAIASRAGLNAAHAGRRFGFQYATGSEQQVLEDARVNTVAIVTRHSEHARQVLAGLRAGKHVWCEKPLALRGEDVDAVEAALAGSDRLLTVGYNRRFAPLALALREFVCAAHAPLAMHYRINAGALPATHWLNDPEQGGGRILGEACHFIDFLIYLVGAPPVRLSAAALPDAGASHEENAIVTLEFPDGSLGTVAYLANGDRALPKERLEVSGGGRAAVLDDFRRLETYAAGARRVQRSWLRQDKGHAAMWRAFAAAIRAGGPPPIPYDQLLASSRAALAAVEALRTRTPVRLELNASSQ